MELSYLICAVLVAACATYLTRLLPFVCLRFLRDSAWLSFVRASMPLAVLSVLLVYSLKDASWQEDFAYREILSLLLVIGSYLWRKNALLSIFIGVGFYMILLRLS